MCRKITRRPSTGKVSNKFKRKGKFDPPDSRLCGETRHTRATSRQMLHKYKTYGGEKALGLHRNLFGGSCLSLCAQLRHLTTVSKLVFNRETKDEGFFISQGKCVLVGRRKKEKEKKIQTLDRNCTGSALKAKLMLNFEKS